MPRSGLAEKTGGRRSPWEPWTVPHSVFLAGLQDCGAGAVGTFRVLLPRVAAVAPSVPAGE